ncbi:MAG: hypothetical protein LBQ69_05825 [Treponema sp.]|jgi:hypothetical protein|nr:hypothetical protein [Treponema sp.]
MPLSRRTLLSPALVFVAYVLAASLAILGFRLVFPGEISPLPIFSRDWRLIQGLVEIISLFPAIAFSALVIPFGISPPEGEDAYSMFSPRLFKRMMSPIVTAICAAAVYALLFFLALPLARNFEENMRFQGERYRIARNQAQAHGKEGEWLEASQLIGICDSVWKDSPELAALRAEVEIRLAESPAEAGSGQAARERGAGVSALPGQREPLNAAEALALSEAALNEGRVMDAHWFATLGGRIAREGSPEAATAARLASRAWNQIESQRPSPIENRAYSAYQLKLTGYEAMVSGDWVRAFYLFQELAGLTPLDPDAERFLAASEKGTMEIAFFIDELEMSPGEAHVRTIFSLPGRKGGPSQGQARAVMRVSSLSASPDFAFGIGVEYMAFDSGANLLFSLRAPYAKFLPITLDGQRQVIVLMRALERNDPALRWEPQWNIPENSPMSGAGIGAAAQVMLPVSYETFLMLTRMRYGLSSLQIKELFSAREVAPETGYIPEVFEAEIFSRLGSCLFFLPMAIVAIIIGWRYRARRQSRFYFPLMVPFLPVVFNGFAYLCRTAFNVIGSSLILALGFSTALPLFIAIVALSFLLTLILLAAQHG